MSFLNTMDNLLEKLWKPATGVKPESLIGKICRHSEFKKPVTLYNVSDGLAYYYEHILGYPSRCMCSIKFIEYLDESPEGISSLLKEATKELQYEIDRLNEERLTSYSVGRAEAELEAGCYTEKQVRDIIDETWGFCYEDKSVPSTMLATELIKKALTSNPNEHTP